MLQIVLLKLLLLLLVSHFHKAIFMDWSKVFFIIYNRCYLLTLLHFIMSWWTLREYIVIITCVRTKTCLACLTHIDHLHILTPGVIRAAGLRQEGLWSLSVVCGVISLMGGCSLTRPRGPKLARRVKTIISGVKKVLECVN